jgi:hypothetical protein
MESAPWLLLYPAPGVNASEPAFSARHALRAACCVSRRELERQAGNYFAAAFILS